jgi:putative RecB family exonuclease
MPSLAELRAKPHTSVSQVKTFLSCPRRYYYQYTERATPAFKSVSLVLGTAWHATLAEHFTRSRPNDPVRVDELRAHLRDGIVRGIEGDGVPVLFDEDEQDTNAVIDTGMHMLDAFLQHVPLPEHVLGVEVPFSIPLAHPVTGAVLPVPLVGAMDAIVEEEGRPIVVEWKSGKRRWSKDEMALDGQTTAYRRAAASLGYKQPGLRLVLTTKSKRPAVQIEDLVRHDQDERELIETVFDIHRAIDAGVNHRMRGWPCKSCPYAEPCGS